MFTKDEESRMDSIVDDEAPAGDTSGERASDETTSTSHQDKDAASVESSETADSSEEADEKSVGKLTKKQILSRLVEKNDLIHELVQKGDALESEAKDLKDKWLRSHAEFENYRRRTQKEWELLKQQTKAEIILEILDVVDNFERAFSASGEDNGDLVKGIRLIYNNLLSTLEKFGVREMEAEEASFDPAFHMAVAQVETDKVKSNHVAEVIQKGYFLEDTVLRPAKVIIAK